MHDQTALLIRGNQEIPGEESVLTEVLRHHELQFRRVSEANALEHLKSDIQGSKEPDIVIIESSVSRPLQLARQIHAMVPLAQLLFFVSPENEKTLSRELAMAPMIGTHWSVGHANDDELPGLVRDAVVSAKQRQRLRTTLDRINLKMAQPAQRLGAEYRKLVLSDRYFRSVLDHAQDAIVSTDGRGHITSLNRAAVELFARAQDEVIGSPITQLCGGQWDESLAHLVHQLQSGGSPSLQTLECKRADGSLFYVEVSAGVVSDELHRPIGFTVIARDITERKKGEEAAALSSQRLQAIFQQTAAGIAQVDSTGRFLEANQRYCEIVGRTMEELRTLRLQEITHPDDLPENASQFQKIFRDGKPFRIEKRYQRPDGSSVWVSNSVSLLTNTKGEPHAAVAVTIDISDRKAAEQIQLEMAKQRESLLESERAARSEAERISQMKDEFLATLSHELRTPLNAILGWSQILQREFPKPDELGQGLEVIARNARAQAQIIEDLLDMSRIISGKVRLDVQRLDLAAVVKSSLETIAPAADAKGIRLLSTIDPLLGVAVSGDVNRMQQILWNLLTNAVKFTPKGGKIHVLLERVNSHVEISVIDSGAGIDPEFLPYVFDRFRQADGSITRQHGGLGLGLAIVKQLVEIHGGFVRVKSAGRGQGATFVVALPLTPVHPAADNEESRRHPTAGPVGGLPTEASLDISGLQVLVVDDEPDARTLVKRLLEDHGANVVTAASASDAFELVRTSRFDVLISDIGMPGEDGYSLIRRVRALGKDHRGETPAIALTAYARSDDRIKAISAGFLMHVAKPVERDELITMVAAAAGRTPR